MPASSFAAIRAVMTPAELSRGAEHELNFLLVFATLGKQPGWKTCCHCQVFGHESWALRGCRAGSTQSPRAPLRSTLWSQRSVPMALTISTSADFISTISAFQAPLQECSQWCWWQTAANCCAAAKDASVAVAAWGAPPPPRSAKGKANFCFPEHRADDEGSAVLAAASCFSICAFSALHWALEKNWLHSKLCCSTWKKVELTEFKVHGRVLRSEGHAGSEIKYWENVSVHGCL